jgi:large subunit ribosomal protein L23
MKVNKIEIKKAVAEMYDVTVDSVRTMVCIGKKRVRGTKSGMIVGKTATYKKAIVTLIEGDSIDFYSNI